MKPDFGKEQLEEVSRALIEKTPEAGDHVSEANGELSEFKQDKQAVRQQVQIMDLVDGCISMRDLEDRITYWNRGAERIYGWTKEEVLGQVAHDLLKTKSLQSFEEIRTQFLIEGHWEGELVQTRHNGIGLTVLSRWTLQKDATDKPVGIVEMNYDISDRKCAEEVLRQSEERFRLLVDGVQDYAIFMLSPKGDIISWNKGAERIKGYKADEIIGKHFSWFYPPEDIALGKPERELRTAIEEGQMENEGWRVRQDGQQFWASIVITALVDKAGCLLGFAKITRDMTERKRIEQALYDKNIAFEHAAKSKNRFLANMSHELRTPLNGIIGFAEFLADGKPGHLNRKQEEYLDDILNSGRHLLQLINDVLDLAKIEANKMDFYPEKFTLARVIEDVCAVVKPIAQKKSIKIGIEVATELGDVYLDRQKFKQVLYNLISNAVKFNDEGGRVDVFASLLECRHLKLAVRDTGIGIRAKDISRLFAEFEQLQSGGSRRYEGTGLGLALTRKIIELQGGTIGVESEVGKGSTFTAILPLEGEK